MTMLHLRKSLCRSFQQSSLLNYYISPIHRFAKCDDFKTYHFQNRSNHTQRTLPAMTTTEDVESLVNKFAHFKPMPVSMKQHLDFGQKPSEQDAFSFLRNEIPVRLSNMIKEMDHLPARLLENKNVRMVRDWYVLSFKEVIEYQKANEKDPMILRRFRELLPNILNRHSDVVPVIARGVMELRDRRGIDASTERQIHYFLDRFYMSKISIRMLLHQHVLLFSGRPAAGSAPTSKNIGCIDPNCNFTSALYDAYEDAKLLCENNYNCSPKMIVQVFKMGVEMPPDTPVNLVYVPSHIHHILFEIIKNAMRAEAEKGENAYQNGKPKELAPLRALISQGRDDVTIRVSDRGGGIPRRNIEMVFNYAFTTAKTPVIPGQEQEHVETDTVPMAGYGYGLPLTRLYARYFNGEIVLSSIDGFGTDAYTYFRNLPTEASELLPAYTRAEASRAYDGKTSPETSTWLEASRQAASHHAGVVVEQVRHNA